MKSEQAKDEDMTIGLRPISGGSGGTLTVEDKAEIVGAVQSVMQPHVDGIATLTSQVSELRAENENLKKLVRIEREGDTERFLLNGQKFPLGQGVAPASVRSGSLGDEPFRLVDFARMALTEHRGGDVNKFSRVREISAKLQKFGHTRSADFASTILPITTNPDYFFTGTDEASAFVRELKSMIWVDPDPESTADQIRWVLAKMATKGVGPQATDDDSLGGFAAQLPRTGDIIPLLQATSALGRAGARSVPLPPEGMRWPRQVSAPEFTYVNENGTIPFTDITFGVVNMSVKKAGAIIKIPNEMLLMVNAAESFFRSALVKAAALTEDKSGLDGIGPSTQPLGIARWPRSAADTPEDGKVTLHVAQFPGANGDTVGPLDPMSMLTNLEDANYPDGATAFLMRPRMWQTLRSIRADSGGGAGTGPWLFDPMRTMGMSIPKSIEGVPVITSTQIAKNLRKGSATNLTYILAGDFSQVYMGRVGTVELATDSSLGFREEQIWIRAIYRHDIALAQPQAMNIMTQLIGG